MLRILILPVFILLAYNSSCQPVNPYTPPEYFQSKAVLIEWPFNHTIWPLYSELINECQEVVEVILVVRDQDEEDQMRSLLASDGVPQDNISFVHVPCERMWIRDHGPLSIHTDTGIAFMDFDDLADSGLDEDLPTNLANIWGLDSYQIDWILCGGNFMVDSHGTLFSTDRLYTNNPTIPSNTIDEVLQTYMGIEQIVTVSAQHDDYWGHIDMQMKLLNDTIMVISSVEPSTGPNYDILESNYQIIANLTAPNGKPYHIARLPKADNWKTYANSLILNKKVIVPIYDHPNDETALGIYAQLLPQHEIVGINANSIIGWEGAIHCITMQLFDETYFETSPEYMLTLKSYPDNIEAVLIGEGEHEEGSSVQISTSDVDNYDFVEWTGLPEDVELLEDATLMQTYFEMPNRDVTLTANYELSNLFYTVNFSIFGSADGTLTAFVDDEQIYNGDQVEEGKNISFYASPNHGFEIDYWKINDEIIQDPTLNTLTINSLDSDIEITVQFNPIFYSVLFTVNEIDGEANGTLSATVDGNAISTGDLVQMGKTIIFTAVPAEGFKVNRWELDNEVQNTLSTEFTKRNLPKSINITIEFNEIPEGTHLVKFSTSDDNGGITATVEGEQILNGEYIDDGKDIVFSAIPNENFSVKKWSLNGNTVSNHNNETLIVNNVNQSINVAVSFEAKAYIITFEAVDENGTVLASANEVPINSGDSVEKGSELVFTAQANQNFKIKNWYLNGTILDNFNEETLAFNNISQNIEVLVSFEPILFTVNFETIGENGSLSATSNGVTISNGDSIQQGNKVYFVATPNDYYEVNQWLLNGTALPSFNDSILVINSLSQNIYAAVSFDLTKHTISFAVDGDGGSISAASNGADLNSGDFIYHGDDVIFKARPNKHYSITQWFVNGNLITGHTDSILSMSEVNQSIDVLIRFEQNKHSVYFYPLSEDGNLSAFVNGAAIASGDIALGGSEVVFKATPNNHHRISAWYLNDTIVSNQYDSLFHVDEIHKDIYVNVSFEPIKHVVSFWVDGGNGAISCLANGLPIDTQDEVVGGSDLLFIANPEADYQVDKWYLNGNLAIDDSTRYFALNNLSTDVNVSVKFSLIPPKLFMVTFGVLEGEGTVTASVNDSTIHSGDFVQEGSEIIFNAIPEIKYEVSDWIVDGNAQNFNNSVFVIGSLNFDIDVLVVFSQIASNHSLPCNTLNLHPNPFSKSININSSFGLQSVKVINLQGLVVFEDWNINNTTATIDLPSLANGIYIIVIETVSGENYVDRVIKE